MLHDPAPAEPPGVEARCRSIRVVRLPSRTRFPRCGAGTCGCPATTVRSASDGVASYPDKCRTSAARLGGESLSAHAARRRRRNSPRHPFLSSPYSNPSPPLFFPLALATQKAGPFADLIGYRPPTGKFWVGDDSSVFRDGPLGKSTVKAAAAKQAAKERGSEKRLSASRTFPICQTGCEKEVTDKC
jgi:hypothetical protein